MATTAELLEAAATGDLGRLKDISVDCRNVEVFRRICVTFKDGGGLTALHCAAQAGKTRICRYLVEDVKVDVNMKTLEDDSTPLLLAVKSERLHTVYHLIRSGADARQSDSKQKTALHYAAEKGLQKIMLLLILQGVEIDANSNYGTPLQCAAAYGKKEAVKILLDHHSDPSLASPHLPSPVMFSISTRSFDCLDMLLKAGADPNGMSNGQTPLAFTALKSENEFLKFLLKAGADPNVVGRFGMTPLEFAAMSGNIEGTSILLPLTSRLPSVPNWSLHGIMTYVNSKEAKDQRELKRKEDFLLAKQRGAAAVERNDYVNAIMCYTEAIYLIPTDAAVLSNRSLCWARLNDGYRALSDAQACVQLRPDWAKAHYREGFAWKLLKNYSRTSEAFSQAMRLDPGNKEIQKAFKEAAEAEFGMEVSDNIRAFNISMP